MKTEFFYALWHKDVGCSEGSIFATKKRVRKWAVKAFNREWNLMRYSGFSVIAIEVPAPTCVIERMKSKVERK